MPTMTANTMNAKYMQPALAIQAVAEPWQSLAEHELQPRAITAAATPTSNRSPRWLKRLKPAQLLLVGRAVDADQAQAASCRTNEHHVVSAVLAAQASRSGAAHLWIASRSKA